MAVNDTIGLTEPGSPTKKLRTFKVNIAGIDTEQETVVVVDSLGNLLGLVHETDVYDTTKYSFPMMAKGIDAPSHYYQVRIDVDGDLMTHIKNAAEVVINPAKEDGNLANCKADLDTIASQTAQTPSDGRTYKQKNSSCNSAGDNAVIAAVGGKVLKIYDISLQGQGTVVVTPSSDVGGSASAIGQPWSFQAREGKNKHGVPAGAPYDYVTAQGKAFNLYLSAGVVVGYEIIYTDSDAS